MRVDGNISMKIRFYLCRTIANSQISKAVMPSIEKQNLVKQERLA